ncbi:unnamed protein product [Amoebophrya sp. A25]|nr:unnamed protein product [Amoebophrya sp. A25]|eukprot:GSA25T00007458001.1
MSPLDVTYAAEPPAAATKVKMFNNFFAPQNRTSASSGNSAQLMGTIGVSSPLDASVTALPQRTSNPGSSLRFGGGPPAPTLMGTIGREGPQLGFFRSRGSKSSSPGTNTIPIGQHQQQQQQQQQTGGAGTNSSNDNPEQQLIGRNSSSMMGRGENRLSGTGAGVDMLGATVTVPGSLVKPAALMQGHVPDLAKFISTHRPPPINTPARVPPTMTHLPGNVNASSSGAAFAPHPSSSGGGRVPQAAVLHSSTAGGGSPYDPVEDSVSSSASRGLAEHLDPKKAKTYFSFDSPTAESASNQQPVRDNNQHNSIKSTFYDPFADVYRSSQQGQGPSGGGPGTAQTSSSSTGGYNQQGVVVPRTSLNMNTKSQPPEDPGSPTLPLGFFGSQGPEYYHTGGASSQSCQAQMNKTDTGRGGGGRQLSLTVQLDESVWDTLKFADTDNFPARAAQFLQRNRKNQILCEGLVAEMAKLVAGGQKSGNCDVADLL